MPVYRETLTYRDAKGQTARLSVYCTAATFAAATPLATTLAGAITTCSNGYLAQATGPYTLAPAPAEYGTAAQFLAAADKANMTFTTASGAVHRFSIPCPIAAIFQADLETVDPTNADVTSLVTAMLAVGSSRDGSAITAFVGGTRIRRKMPRRFNIFTKDPALTGPGE